MIPTLKGETVKLRAPSFDDAAALTLHLNDFSVSGNLARVPYPYHLSDAVAWLRTQREEVPAELANFAIAVDGIGYVGHVGYQPTAAGPVLGYWLGQKFWGRGLMSEAARLAVDWFFASSTADAIISGVFHFNAPSLAIQRKLGFVETGRSQMLCLARGVEVEHIDTRLTRSVWKARRT